LRAGLLTPTPELLAALGLTGAKWQSLGGGDEDSAVFRLETAAAAYALRLRPARALPALRHEAAAARAAHAAGLPAPEPLRLAVAGGIACLLSTWCPGVPLAAAVIAGRADPEALGAACGRLQATLNALPAPSEVRSASPLSWQAAQGREALALEGVPGLGKDRLLHLDFHPLNLLTDGRAITGIVDWSNAGAGDPRQDLARSLAILRLDAPNVLEEDPAAAARILAMAEPWRAAYAGAAGPQADMASFLAWAGLRTVRDLEGKRRPDQLARMRGEAERWLREAQAQR